MIHAIFHWFLHVTGSDNTSGTWYGFWSGFGSDLGEITLITGLLALWKSHECHVDKCHRRGKHEFEHYKLCSKHHPKVPEKVTHLHIMQLHKQTTKTK